jgi:nucleoside-diphosphate-sugar epimerase
MRVFVTGGTGFIGGHVLASLVRAGHTVLALTRNEPPHEGHGNGIAWLRGSIEEPSTWQEHLRECQACVHLVGILREFPERGVTFEKIHYKATVELLRQCARLNVKRFIYLSANGVEKGLNMPYMRTKALAEQAVLSSGLSWTILRPSVVYGGAQGRDNFVAMLSDVVRKAPMLPILGNGTYRLAPISAGEVAETISTCLTNQDSVGKIYHLCGNETYTFKAILYMILEAQGSQANTIHVPFWFVSQVAALFGRFSWFPVTKDMLLMLKYGNDCPDAALTQNALDVRPVSFRDWLQSPESLMGRHAAEQRRELPATGARE